MERAIQKAMRATPERAEDFIIHAGGVQQAALDLQTPLRCPVSFVNLEPIHCVNYRERLKVWSNAWETTAPKVLEFLAEATAFEFGITLTVNPMYPCTAFSGTRMYDACKDLVAREKLYVYPAQHVYAVAYTEITQRRSMKRSELAAALRRARLTYMDPSTIQPFPSDILNNHPLEDMDLNYSSSGRAMALLKKNKISRPLDRVRERREMCNRIEKVVCPGQEDVFKIREGASRFVQLIHALNVPI